MRHGYNQVDQKTKANARTNPYMIILGGGTTTTSAPPDVVLELALVVVGNGDALKHPIDVVIAVFAPLLARSPKQFTLSDVGLVAIGGSAVGSIDEVATEKFTLSDVGLVENGGAALCSIVEVATKKLRLYGEGSHAKNFWPVVIAGGIFITFMVGLYS